MAIIIIMAQATSHAPCTSNCACAEGLHFSAFHFKLVPVRYRPNAASGGRGQRVSSAVGGVMDISAFSQLRARVLYTPLFISVLMVEISAPVLVFQLSRWYTVINLEGW